MRPDLLPKLKGTLLELSGTFFPAMRVGDTASETMDEDSRSGFKLVRYRPGVGNTKRVLFVPHIINRPYILDLHPDVSVVRRFCDHGFDVHMIDWGYPTREQSDLSFADYVLYVDRALGLISDRPVSLLGYCTGGIVGLMYASLHPDLVAALVLLATPVDFSMPHDIRIFLGRSLSASTVTAISGYMPGELINLAGVFLLAWGLPAFSSSPEFVQEWFSFESWRDIWRRIRWLVDAPAVPGRAFTELLEGCYNDNRLIKNGLVVGDRTVRLGQIRCPLANIISKYDHLVPVESATALRKVYSGAEYHEVIFNSSHVGLSVGRRAHRELWPGICDWTASRP